MLYTKKTLLDLENNFNQRIDEIRTEFERELETHKDALEEKFEQETAKTVEALKKSLKDDAQSIFQEALEADRKKRYDSDEPFVEIISQTFSEEGGVQLRLDWNQPFIKYLKTNGFTGPSDESIVDNWLVSLSRERIAEGGSEYK